MKKIFALFSILIIMAISAVACSPKLNTVEQPQIVVSEDSTLNTEVEESMPEEPIQADVSLPVWYTTPLTDVDSGAVFTIEENLGKVILVETLATWCSNCMSQQREVAKLHDLLGDRNDFISLGIDIDPREDIQLLRDYVQKNGFDWLYVVANDEMVDEISLLYGPQFLNPPSTPMLIIDKNGIAHPLDFGIKNAEKLLESVTEYLNESAF